MASAACRRPDEVEKAAVPSVHADTVAVEERSMPRVVPLTGTLLANLRTELTANASGRVVKTFVERGQRVTQGTVIAQLDVRAAALSVAEANANVASATTQFQSARDECTRYDALLARGAVSKQEYDKQTAECRQQFAKVAVSQAHAVSASLNVGDGTIRAPFTGIVTERWVTVGDYVRADSKVVTLVVSDPLRLNITVPERRIAEVKDGATVSFAAVALPGRTFTGAIRYMSQEVRPTTRDMIVEAIVANPDGVLLPGMFVELRLLTGEQPMLVVPASAVFDTGSEKSMYVVSDRRLSLRIIRVGAAAGDVVAVEEGAAKGDRVVKSPSDAMFDGQPVD
jgi:membrane fusion protein, multidrug efflux system